MPTRRIGQTKAAQNVKDLKKCSASSIANLLMVFPFRLSPASDMPRFPPMHKIAELSHSRLLRTVTSDQGSCLVGIHPQECARTSIMKPRWNIANEIAYAEDH